MSRKLIDRSSPISRPVLVGSDEIYAGFVPRGPHAMVPVPSGPHVLVSGPTGSGKSRRVLAPATNAWSGPVISVSSKPDLLGLSAATRIENGGAGHTYVLDLADALSEDHVPEGVRRVYFDPTRMIRNDDDALDLARSLLPRGNVRDAFWDNASVTPLAALLRACFDDGVAYAIEARSRVPSKEVSSSDLETSVELFEEWGDASWVGAYRRLKSIGSPLAGGLASLLASDAYKMTASIAMIVETALLAWSKGSLVLPHGSSETALFTPTLLQHERATLFIIAPATGVGTQLATTILETVIDRWRKNQVESVRLPRLLLVVDELCNTAPLEMLPVLVTEARAMNVAMLAAVQSTLQFARRYGQAGMEELRDVFPATLCLVGSTETYLWNKVERIRGSYAKARVASEDLPRTAPVPAASVDEATLFYTARPEGVENLDDYLCGRSVRLFDLGELSFDVEEIDEGGRETYEDRFPPLDHRAGVDLVDRRVEVARSSYSPAYFISTTDATASMAEQMSAYVGAPLVKLAEEKSV